MDEYAVAAICALPPGLQGSDAERFFDLIIEMYRDGTAPASLDEMVPQIEQRDSSLVTAATQFRDNLRMQGLDQSWPGIARTLASEAGTGSGLATLRDQYTAQAAAAGAAGGAPDWAAFRAQNLDFWSGWNGTDWPTWRTAFARLIPAELRAETEPQLTYLDRLDPAGQLSYLRDTLGFTINQQALDYHQTAGTSAGATGAGEPGARPEPAAGEATPEPPAGQAVAAAAESLIAASAGALTSQDAALVTPELARQAIEEVPGAAALSPEDLAEVMREVAEAIG